MKKGLRLKGFSLLKSQVLSSEGKTEQVREDESDDSEGLKTAKMMNCHV